MLNLVCLFLSEDKEYYSMSSCPGFYHREIQQWHTSLLIRSMIINTHHHDLKYFQILNVFCTSGYFLMTTLFRAAPYYLLFWTPDCKPAVDLQGLQVKAQFFFVFHELSLIIYSSSIIFSIKRHVLPSRCQAPCCLQGKQAGTQEWNMVLNTHPQRSHHIRTEVFGRRTEAEWGFFVSAGVHLRRDACTRNSLRGPGIPACEWSCPREESYAVINLEKRICEQF